VPDPVGAFEEYLPYVVLAEVLTDGDASRLVERLVLKDRTATSVSGYCGFMGDAFDVRDPTVLILSMHSPPGVEPDRVLGAVEQELDRLAADGLDGAELRRVQARLATHLLNQVDPVMSRTLSMAVLEQQRGRAEFAGELPRLLAQVTTEQVRAAAATLRPARRAVLEVRAGGAR
jgi:zinc protease